MTTGCVHVHITDGNIVKVFLHLTDLPSDGVIHLSPDEVLSAEAFMSTHPSDADEVAVAPCREYFDLGDDSVQAE
jgi:hypothetical protein